MQPSFFSGFQELIKNGTALSPACILMSFFTPKFKCYDVLVECQGLKSQYEQPFLDNEVSNMDSYFS